MLRHVTLLRHSLQSAPTLAYEGLRIERGRDKGESESEREIERDRERERER